MLKFRWASLGSDQRVFATVLAVLLAGLPGCVTPPPTYRTTADAPTVAAKLRTVAVLPIDIEVAELTAGGITEKRDDWTQLVDKNLQASLTKDTVFKPAPPFPAETAAELQAELKEIHALFRAITTNQFVHSFMLPLDLTSTRGALTYQLGPMDKLVDASGADAVLIVFVRDDYATGGRKTVAFLGALAGIPVRTGVTISSAALVTRDGRLQWMNHNGAVTGDLRTPEGAGATVKKLIVGTPALGGTN